MCACPNSSLMYSWMYQIYTYTVPTNPLKITKIYSILVCFRFKISAIVVVVFCYWLNDVPSFILSDVEECQLSECGGEEELGGGDSPLPRSSSTSDITQQLSDTLPGIKKQKWILIPNICHLWSLMNWHTLPYVRIVFSWVTCKLSGNSMKMEKVVCQLSCQFINYTLYNLMQSNKIAQQ